MKMERTARNIAGRRGGFPGTENLENGIRAAAGYAFAMGILEKYLQAEGYDLPSASFVYPEAKGPEESREAVRELVRELRAINRIRISSLRQSYEKKYYWNVRLRCEQLFFRLSGNTFWSREVRELQTLYRELVREKEEPLPGGRSAPPPENEGEKTQGTAPGISLKEMNGPGAAAASVETLREKETEQRLAAVLHQAERKPGRRPDAPGVLRPGFLASLPSAQAPAAWQSRQGRQFFWKVQRAPQWERELLFRAAGVRSLPGLEKRLSRIPESRWSRELGILRERTEDILRDQELLENIQRETGFWNGFREKETAGGFKTRRETDLKRDGQQKDPEREKPSGNPGDLDAKREPLQKPEAARYREREFPSKEELNKAADQSDTAGVLADGFLEGEKKNPDGKGAGKPDGSVRSDSLKDSLQPYLKILEYLDSLENNENSQEPDREREELLTLIREQGLAPELLHREENEKFQTGEKTAQPRKPETEGQSFGGEPSEKRSAGKKEEADLADRPDRRLEIENFQELTGEAWTEWKRQLLFRLRETVLETAVRAVEAEEYGETGETGRRTGKSPGLETEIWERLEERSREQVFQALAMTEEWKVRNHFLNMAAEVVSYLDIREWNVFKTELIQAADALKDGEAGLENPVLTWIGAEKNTAGPASAMEMSEEKTRFLSALASQAGPERIFGSGYGIVKKLLENNRILELFVQEERNEKGRDREPVQRVLELSEPEWKIFLDVFFKEAGKETGERADIFSDRETGRSNTVSEAAGLERREAVTGKPETVQRERILRSLALAEEWKVRNHFLNMAAEAVSYLDIREWGAFKTEFFQAADALKDGEASLENPVLAWIHAEKNTAGPVSPQEMSEEKTRFLSALASQAGPERIFGSGYGVVKKLLENNRILELFVQEERNEKDRDPEPARRNPEPDQRILELSEPEWKIFLDVFFKENGEEREAWADIFSDRETGRETAVSETAGLEHRSVPVLSGRERSRELQILRELPLEAGKRRILEYLQSGNPENREGGGKAASENQDRVSGKKPGRENRPPVPELFASLGNQEAGGGSGELSVLKNREEEETAVLFRRDPDLILRRSPGEEREPEKETGAPVRESGEEIRQTFLKTEKRLSELFSAPPAVSRLFSGQPRLLKTSASSLWLPGGLETEGGEGQTVKGREAALLTLERLRQERTAEQAFQASVPGFLETERESGKQSFREDREKEFPSGQDVGKDLRTDSGARERTAFSPADSPAVRPEEQGLPPYGLADLVVSQGGKNRQRAGETVPEAPAAIRQEIKKQVQEEFTDIQFITREQSVSKGETISGELQMEELLKRMENQEKELEQIRKLQEAVQNDRPEARVSRTVMKKIQDQMQLERLRRGL